MSTPFYVSPQQAMADRAEYARKGIARGRSVVVLQYTDGIVFVAENPSRALHKISEIYDRIAFAAVGKYNEFENLRIGGVRYADLRGYTYDRADVTARGLANVYAQTLGTIFSSAAEKPYEVELVVAEVARPRGRPDLPPPARRLDRRRARLPRGRRQRGPDQQLSRSAPPRGDDPLRGDRARRRGALAATTTAGNGELTADQLEVAVLDRTRPQQRKFQRTGPSARASAGRTDGPGSSSSDATPRIRRTDSDGYASSTGEYSACPGGSNTRGGTR